MVVWQDSSTELDKTQRMIRLLRAVLKVMNYYIIIIIIIIIILC